MEQQEQLTEFKIQLALPAPNIEVAQEVANKAQVLINEVSMQKQNALNILNNKAKFEAVVSECDNILGLINNRSESPRNPAPDFEEFKLSMNERLTNQETLLLRIAQELGLDKPKQ